MIQRIPSNSRSRQTSSVTVVVRNRIDSPVIEVSKDDVKIDRYRGTGAGGQRKNKVSTAIRLYHKPTGITITRETGRSQHANLQDAYRQLETELHSRQKQSLHEQVDSARYGDVLVDQTKSFTYNTQRGIVISHMDGKKRPMKAWLRGGIIRGTQME